MRNRGAVDVLRVREDVRVGHVDVSGIRFELPDGRVLLDDVSFRVGEGAKVALVGANGAGKTTLLRIVTGDLQPHAGAVTRSGGLGVMRQMVTHGNDGWTVHDLLLSVAPPRVRAAAAHVERAELAMMETDDEQTQMAYAAALSEWADAGGYDIEVLWDVCTIAAFGIPYDRAKYRDVKTLSGGEQKRLVLEALLRGPDEVLLLDEPDNFLDVPGKLWLEERLRESPKTVLFVSHDRELMNNAATRVVTVELGAAGNTVWMHPGQLRDVPPGADRSVRPTRGDAQALGRGARQAQGARADVQAEGGLQRRDGVALSGSVTQTANVRGEGAAGEPAARAERQDATARGPHRQASRRLRAARAHRTDAAVRPGGLVRRAGRRAWLQRVGQVALPAVCWPPVAPTPTSSIVLSARCRSSRSTTPVGPSSAPGFVRAGSCRRTNIPS